VFAQLSPRVQRNDEEEILGWAIGGVNRYSRRALRDRVKVDCEAHSNPAMIV